MASSPNQRVDTSGSLNSQEHVFSMEPINTIPPYIGQRVPQNVFPSPRPLNRRTHMAPRRYISAPPLSSVSPHTGQPLAPRWFPSPQPLINRPPYTGQPMTPRRSPSPSPLNSVPPHTGQHMAPRWFASPQSLNNMSPYIGQPMTPRQCPSTQPLNSAPPYASQPTTPHRYLSPQLLNYVPPYRSQHMIPPPLTSAPPHPSPLMPHLRFPSPQFRNSGPPYGSPPMTPPPLTTAPPPNISQPSPPLSPEPLNIVPPYVSQPMPPPSPHNLFRPFQSPLNPFSSHYGQFQSSSRTPIVAHSIIFPFSNSPQELENISNLTRSGVLLTGSAISGPIGPQIGAVDIGESEDSFYFRISLAGVSQHDFKCEVNDEGQVIVKGVTITGERIVQRGSQVYVMQTRNLCPPGEFSIAFQLPGPVDAQQFDGNFQNDGILVGTVKKARRNEDE